jgi:hypothetical protein
MKNRLYSLALALCLTGAAFGQVNTMYSTTVSTAALSTDAIIYVASNTNMTAPSPASATPSGSQLYVIAPGNPRGETMMIQSINGTAISVARGRTGGRFAIPVGATVLFGPPNWFRAYDPSGGCTTATTYITPHVNVLTGAEWLCSPVSLTWAPSWGNPGIDSFVPTAAVASAAGLITPSGPLFHVTGALAVTGFNIPLGFVSGSFTIIPDGAFTTTTANNIAIASTGVVSKPLTFLYDSVTAKFYPSY